jgi:CDP-paratose 2-epimerase
MKILITGGCGFVGSNIAIYLKKKLKQVNILSIDNLFRKGSEINKLRLKKHGIKNYNLDIRNYKKINSLKKFDLVIDCCAEPAIEASFKEPDRVFETNLVGTFNILKKCINDKTNIIFLSTSRVYSIQNLKKLVNKHNLTQPIKIKNTIDEKFKTSLPSSLYGFTKLSSEKLIREFSFTGKIKYIINRFGVISGPWQFGKQDQGFISLWIARHVLKKKLSYVGFGGYGNQVRDVIHIDDVCEIIFLQIKKLDKVFNKTFNVGGGIKNKISLKELTLKCQELTSNKLKIGRTTITSKYDIPYYVTNNSKIKSFYNWKPTKNINKILEDIYNWIIKNKSIIEYFK